MLYRIRMIIYFTFKLHLLYQNIDIHILKLQKKLILISAERDFNNAPQNIQVIIDHQSIVNIKVKVFGNLVNKHKERLQSFFTKQYIFDIEFEYKKMIEEYESRRTKNIFK